MRKMQADMTERAPLHPTTNHANAQDNDSTLHAMMDNMAQKRAQRRRTIKSVVLYE